MCSFHQCCKSSVTLNRPRKTAFHPSPSLTQILLFLHNLCFLLDGISWITLQDFLGSVESELDGGSMSDPWPILARQKYPQSQISTKCASLIVIVFWGTHMSLEIHSTNPSDVELVDVFLQFLLEQIEC